MALSTPLSDDFFELVARRFRALSEPVRLKLVAALRDNELNVSELVVCAGTTQANVSRHLSVLTHAGLLRRERRGNEVIYSVQDEALFELCDIVCGSVRKSICALQKEAVMPKKKVS